jgi:hypothetical protein
VSAVLDTLFCSQCGGPVRATPFCPGCGAPVRGAGAAGWTQPERPDQARVAGNDRHSSKRAIQVGAAALALVVLIGAVVWAVTMRGGSTHAPSYPAQAGQLLGPVLADNGTLASAVAALAPGQDTQPVRAALANATATTRTAQQSLAQLTAPGSQTTLATQLTAALTAETAWLQTATGVLANPASPQLSQLSGLGQDAQAKLQAVTAELPAAGTASFPSSAPIVGYASAANAAAAARAKAATDRAKTAADTRQFSDQVLGLLRQSTPSFQQLNAFAQQLATAAAGGYVAMTVAQAEQQISAIVANRTSLAASAQSLTAPTSLAKTVQADLVAAFQASLKDDNDLASCLNQANDGSEAFIFQSCLDASAADSAAATAAKQTFRTAYNRLRARIGQPAVNIAF